MIGDDRPAWDDAQARAILGKRVLVGLTLNDPAGPRQQQLFGVVTSADRGSGIALLLEGERAGETYRLPPDLGAFHPAPPGEYRLRATGEIVVDPDYLSTWSIDPPA